jgi:hypothetical protein
VTTLLAEGTNGLIVTVSSNVSHFITVVATYNASGFVSTKIRGGGNNVNIILGASNAKRLGQFHQNTINASVSGATLDNVEQCISLATSKKNNVDIVTTTFRYDRYFLDCFIIV